MARKLSLRGIGEAIAVIGVIGSLIFVGLEVRQNTIQSRAEAYQSIGLATSLDWIAVSMDRDLAAGATTEISLPAGVATVDRWTAHPGVSACAPDGPGRSV